MGLGLGLGLGLGFTSRSSPREGAAPCAARASACSAGRGPRPCGSPRASPRPTRRGPPASPRPPPPAALAPRARPQHAPARARAGGGVTARARAGARAGARATVIGCGSGPAEGLGRVRRVAATRAASRGTPLPRSSLANSTRREPPALRVRRCCAPLTTSRWSSFIPLRMASPSFFGSLISIGTRLASSWKSDSCTP